MEYSYIDDSVYDSIINYMTLDDVLIPGVKDYLINVINNIIDTAIIPERSKIYIYKKYINHKIKIYNDGKIYIFYLSPKINNLYTIWTKGIRWMT